MRTPPSTHRRPRHTPLATCLERGRRAGLRSARLTASACDNFSRRLRQMPLPAFLRDGRRAAIPIGGASLDATGYVLVGRLLWRAAPRPLAPGGHCAEFMPRCCASCRCFVRCFARAHVHPRVASCSVARCAPPGCVWLDAAGQARVPECLQRTAGLSGP
ncbi:hypothetical protein FA95DRAFT_961445 [Auriscalpium vulgare]|uniref:Uncharacterized protein n=1 Tax=Auriscalpium vulgare TaxID=40419 RepID=A0ACB8RZQ4_9AGAM|nr:hypothetical protein FA95DRAFT_961445 [Auriscalpium vulgare]